MEVKKDDAISSAERLVCCSFIFVDISVDMSNIIRAQEKGHPLTVTSYWHISEVHFTYWSCCNFKIQISFSAVYFLDTLQSFVCFDFLSWADFHPEPDLINELTATDYYLLLVNNLLIWTMSVIISDGPGWFSDCMFRSADGLTPKDIQFPVKYDKEKQEVLTFKGRKLQPANIWC